MRQAHATGNRFIQDAHLVVLLQRANNAAHHHHALGFGRFFNFDNLKTPGQSSIFLKVLLVLRPGRGGDGAQLAASQRGLQQIGGIALPGLPARSDHGVSFVDEKDDWRWRSLYFFDQSLQPVFEFALYASPSLQQSEIKGADRHILQRWRNIALGDAKRKSLDHRRLSHSRFAGQNGIVLTAAGQDVDDLADFKISPQNGIDLAGPGVFGQVDSVLVKIGCLAAFRARCGWLTRRFRQRLDYLLVGAGDDGQEVFAQDFGLDLLELAADFPHQARQLFVGKQRENREAGADLSGVEVDGPDCPSFGQHLQERRAKCGGSRIARLQFVEAARQLGRKPRLVNPEVLH